MGCNNTKIEFFEGTTNEEVEHFSVSIILAARSTEKGKGPQARIENAIRCIIQSIKRESAEVSPYSANKFGEALEALRVDAFPIYTKMIKEIHKTRNNLCKIINYAFPVVVAEVDAVWKNKGFQELKWIPRVVNVNSSTSCLIGNSFEIGLTGPTVEALGFTFEGWVLNNNPQKEEESIMATTLLSCYGDGPRETGASPLFAIDQSGKIIMDFTGVSCNNGKNKPVEFRSWTHVAFVHGQGHMRVFLNGKRVGEKSSPPLCGQASLVMAHGLSGYITECRLWNYCRTDEEIALGMLTIISPIAARSIPGLRLCWLPLRSGGNVRPSGSLMYDVVARKPIGSRAQVNVVPDCRWLSALPPPLIPAEKYTYVADVTSEWNEDWELFSFGKDEPIIDCTKEVYTPLDIRALQFAEAMMAKGGPWIPRIVSLPPGVSACIGTSDDLGITSANGFTVEAWIRLRVISDSENCILGVGFGNSKVKGNLLHASIKGGKPYLGFFGEVSADASLGLPRMRWTHLAFVYGNGMQKVYANGSEIASMTAPLLQGSCALTIGSSAGKHDITGDICELRVWNRSLSCNEINEYMKIAIPPIGARGYRDLRLVWFPLRNGGPFSHHLWVRANEIFKTIPKFDIKKSEELISPVPTLLWDVNQGRDCGRLTTFQTLLTTRTRSIQVAVLIPNDEDYPRTWSKAALAVIDDWTDSFDRIFAPKWFQQHISDYSYAPSDDNFNGNSMTVMAKGPWVPRCMRSRSSGKHGVPVGMTAELGLCNIGSGGREFTLELWVKSNISFAGLDKKNDIVYQDIFGHEDADSTKSTGFLGMFAPSALRIGLANGIPFISFNGILKSTRPSDLKDGAISPCAIPALQWTHLAFVAGGEGKLQIFVNGKLSVAKEKCGALEAKGDRMISAFGPNDRRVASDICEMRMWNCARSESEISNNMYSSFQPLSNGLSSISTLRMSWLPLLSMRSIFWDHKFLVYRGEYCKLEMHREVDVTFPSFTRRPHLLPRCFRPDHIPCGAILDDYNDSFERAMLATLVPPVERDDMGTVLNNYPSDFCPLKKRPATKGLSFDTESISYGDVGWNDNNDGSLIDEKDVLIDDGGYSGFWGYVGLDSTAEEVVDQDISIAPFPNSRRPSKVNISPEQQVVVNTEDVANILQSKSHEESMISEK